MTDPFVWPEENILGGSSNYPPGVEETGNYPD